MKTLVVKYERKDFFGTRLYTEDAKQNFTKADLTKSFLFFSKNHDVALEIDSMTIFWNTIADFENRNVTIRMYDGRSYTEGKMPFDDLKKNFYGKFKKVVKAA